MPKLEIDVNRDTLARLGYVAFTRARTNAEKAGPLIGVPTWDAASVDLRNFWKLWAAEFATINMLGED